MTPNNTDPTPDNPFPQQKFNTGLLETISGMLSGQPIYIVLLTGILCAIAYGAWFGVPTAIKQVQDGYKEIILQNSEQIKELDARHASERKEIREDAKTARQEANTVNEKVVEAVNKLSEKIENSNKK